MSRKRLALGAALLALCASLGGAAPAVAASYSVDTCAGRLPARLGTGHFAGTTEFWLHTSGPGVGDQRVHGNYGAPFYSGALHYRKRTRTRAFRSVVRRPGWPS